MSRIRQAEQDYYRDDLPEIAIGNSVDVRVKIREGEKERIQVFSGTVIKIRGGGLGKTFTVRRIVAGEGVERIFPIHSPVIDSITVTRVGKVRRAKLYYLRDRVGKGTRLREVMGKRPTSTKKAAKPASAPASTPAPVEASEA